MKRSEINAAIQSLIGASENVAFPLPPFARWTPDEWNGKCCECDEIRAAGVGWDVTDFGKGAFSKWGLTLVTGAGDCWCAGFIVGLHENLPLPDAARLGNAAAAHGIQSAGASVGVPSLCEIRRFIHMADSN